MWEGRSREPHLYMHFIHPRARWTSRTWHTHTHRCKQNGRWFTTSLFSNVLLASSLQHPFVFTDRSWQQHLSTLPLLSLQQPTPLLSTATSPTSPPNSLSFFWGGAFKEQGWNIAHVSGCCIEAAPSRPRLGSGAVSRWSVLSVSQDSVWRIVKKDSAQDGVCGGEWLRRALLRCLRADSPWSEHQMYNVKLAQLMWCV